MNSLIDNGDTTLIITGMFPIANLPKLDSLPVLINYARPYYSPISSAFATTGLTTSQGDSAQMSHKAKQAWKVSGDGVKVGVLSDSYNTKFGSPTPAERDVQNGDLPGAANPNFNTDVIVSEEYPYGTGSDEGRAMLQIVHDVAPNAELMFRSGFISAGNFADGIKSLRDSGCKVIVDDITYITEPFFRDGVIAQAVEDVSASGVNYFTSAGNFGIKSYEGVFTPMVAPAGYAGAAHDFGGGDFYQSITLPKGTYTIALQWNDDFYSIGEIVGAQNDLDIFLVDQFGARLFGFNRNNIDGDPLEILPFVVKATSQANIIITRKSGVGNVRFKYVIFRGEGVINEYNQGTGTVIGQANAESAMSIGAVLYKNTPVYGVNPPTVASFSSRGGVLIDGIDRQKPDFCAPNGGNTTVNFGGENIDNDLFPNFFGTSAAAPHAAGVAALLIEAKEKYYAGETFNGAQMKALLKSTAINMDGAGYDAATGAGFIQADAALQTFANPFPIIDDYHLADSAFTPGLQPITLVINGEYIAPDASVIFQYDTIPATVVGNQLTVDLPDFLGNPPLVVYNPPIAPSGLDGGVSDSIYLLSTIPQNVKVTINSVNKKYGEVIPAYSFDVTINDVPMASTGQTLSTLGLTDVTYSTNATNTSDIGLYFRRGHSAVTDLSNPQSLALSAIFNYQFVDGVLTIERMPIMVTPNDMTLVYGDAINGKDIQFTYVYDHIQH
jgi:hypothetical protein